MIRLFAIGLLPLAFAASAADSLAEARAAYARGDFTKSSANSPMSTTPTPPLLNNPTRGKHPSHAASIEIYFSCNLGFSFKRLSSCVLACVSP